MMANEKHLFTLRVWQESLGEQQTEWRGQIKQLKNGEVRYFRDAQTLYAALHELLRHQMQQEMSDHGPSLMEKT